MSKRCRDLPRRVARVTWGFAPDWLPSTPPFDVLADQALLGPPQAARPPPHLWWGRRPLHCTFIAFSFLLLPFLSSLRSVGPGRGGQEGIQGRLKAEQGGHSTGGRERLAEGDRGRRSPPSLTLCSSPGLSPALCSCVTVCLCWGRAGMTGRALQWPYYPSGNCIALRRGRPGPAAAHSPQVGPLLLVVVAIPSPLCPTASLAHMCRASRVSYTAAFPC